MPWFVLRLYALKDRLLSREIPTFASGGRKLRPRRRLRAGAFLAFMGVFLLAGRPAHAGLDVDKIVQTFAELAFSIVGALMKAIVLMIDVLIPIMTYNNFVGNPVVKAGWAIVRDTVNMFFVVILIIIAFGTIFGHKKFQWAQQVPRLLIWAIVINFSKTLCGIMIDFGQVIMLTFANALREIAAGNFIQLLGLNKTYQISQTSAAIQNISSDPAPATLQAFDFFAAGIISVGMTMFVLSTLIVLAAILLFRIIMLWILVVMAPLAWFVKGAEGIIDSNAYKDWWSEFKCLVGVGPILTFFLWLTLTVAGAGNIAINSGFDVSTGNPSDFTSAGLEPTNFLSFLIGAAMLIAGWKAAAQFCSGVSGQFLGKAAGAAKALTKGALIGAPVAASALALKGTAKGTMLGARGAVLAGKGIAAGAKYVPGTAWAARKVSGVRAGTKKLGYRALGKLGGGMRPGLGGAFLSGVAARGMVASEEKEGIRRTQAVAKKKEGLKDKGRGYFAAMGEHYAKNKPTSLDSEAEAMAVLDRAMTDQRLQDQLRASGALEQLWANYGKNFEKDNAHDSAKTDQIKDFKKSNADVTNSAHLINNMNDVRGLSDYALRNPKVQARLRELESDIRLPNGEYMKAYDAVAGGHAGDDKRKILTGPAGALYDTMADDELKRVDVNTLGAGASADTLQRAIEAAMLAGDAGRAKGLISQLSGRYLKDPAKKQDMMLAMDSVAGMLKAESGPISGDAGKLRRAAGWTKDKGVGMIERATGYTSVLKHLESARDMAEKTSSPPPAQLEPGQSGKAFAESMENASPRRKRRAVDQLDDQDKERETQLERVTEERDNFVGGRESPIQAELAALTQSLANARTQIDAELQKKTSDLGTELMAAKKALADAGDDLKFGPSIGPEVDIVKAQQKVDALQAQYDDSKKQTSWPEDRRKAVEADTRVTQIQAQIEVKEQQLTTMTPEEVAALAALDTRVAELTTQGQEIATAIKGLQA